MQINFLIPLSLLLACLSSPLMSAQTSPQFHLLSLFQYEDFSFTSRGLNGTIQGGWSVPERMHFSLSVETVHRFDKTETETAFWSEHYFRQSKRKSRMNAGLSYSPKFKDSGEKILPQWRASVGHGFLPHKKLVLDTTYKFANYERANNHTFGLVSEWYGFKRMYILARWNLTATDFFNSAEWVWNNSLNIQPVIELLSEKLQLNLLYGFSREPFEAGLPGELRSFEAQVLEIGIAAYIKQLKFRCGFDYEFRSNSNFVRRWTFSLFQSW